MHVWGGTENDIFEPGSYDNSMYYLETTTSTWVRPHVEGALPERRSSHAEFVYKGDIYISLEDTMPTLQTSTGMTP